ncbi:MAG TPA: hypothetical protein VK477_04020, partial [Acidobacteriota bacterium]|nr:hypothetical protein [Acidobacteriota bacterium]
GCVSSTNGAISLNSNAEIYGSAHSGGGTVTTSSNVRIHNSTSPSDPKVDPACVRTDFSFTFPAITVPSPTVTNAIGTTITSSRTFPQTGDTANPADGKYYYQFGSGAAIDMDSNKNLTIAGNVVWLFQSHTGVNSIRTSSNADTLFSGDTSTLEIYTNGNISLDSNNDINATGQPQRCQIWGTASTSQTFTLSSNVNLGAVIYAPNAAFQIDSNCVLLGSVVGDTIQMDSNSRFHYDEALGNYGGSNPFRVSSWRELRTAAERATYEDELNF